MKLERMDLEIPLGGNPYTKILFVEDLPSDTELAERELVKNSLRYESLRVDTETAYRSALADFDPDIVISDYSMPAFDGMSALLIAKEKDPFLPFIVLTGSMNEDTAVNCMKAGASDYVIKEHMSRLSFAVKEALDRRKVLEKAFRQEEMIRQSEERYRSIFENSSVAMLIVDPENTAIADANRAAVAFYGWTKEELLDRHLSGIDTMSRRMLGAQIRKALSGEKKFFQSKHKRAGGGVTDVETHNGPISLDGKSFILSIIHDISKRIAAENERDSLSKKLAHYLTTSPTITYSMRMEGDTAKWDWISENVERILGYSVKEALATDWWFNNLLEDGRACARKGMADLIESGICYREYRFFRRDRTIIWLRDERRLLAGSQESTEIVGTLTNITEKKLAEEEITLKSAALGAAENAVVITDREGCIEWVNHGFEKLTGYSMGESIGKNPRELLKSGKQGSAFYRTLWDTIIAGKVWQGLLINKRKSDEEYNEEMTITPVLDDASRIEHFIAIKNDVTEKVRAKAELESSLREKETLLREIHHRVKNNMQVISSMLNLSADCLSDPVDEQFIMEVIRRIEAMAIVHDQFYESEDLNRINFDSYLRQLAASSILDRGTDAERPTLIFETDVTMINLEQAIPAGIIVSEFLSIALDRFTAHPSLPGVLRIRSRLESGTEVEVEIRINDSGSPESFGTEFASSMGKRLIDILAEQLQGKASIKVDGGTIAVLRFPFARE